MKYLYAYRTIAIPSLTVTLLESTLFLIYHPRGYAIIYLLWLKLITLGMLFCYIHFIKPEMLYFYHNLGVSRTGFYTGLVVVDLAFFTAAMALVLSLLKFLV